MIEFKKSFKINMHFNLFHIVLLVCCITISTTLFAQQGIGTDTPDKSAALEIRSEKRGLLIPRVSLQSITDATTMSDGNVESLLVYNTNDQSDMIPGYYYWSTDEGAWKRLLVEGDDLGNQFENSWLDQITNNPATDNTQDIYQAGKVAVGKTEDFLDVSLDVLGSIRGGNAADELFGSNSIAVGDGVVASGNNSVAFGYQSEATAYGAFAGGGFQDTDSSPEQLGGKASGKGSFAYGRETEASGSYSVAMGRETQAQKISSVALGFKSRAQGSYSFVMGNYLRAYSAYEAVFGQYNAFKSGSGSLSSWNLEDPLFEIGNGTGFSNQNSNNALTILKKGWTGIGIIGFNDAAKPTQMLDIGGNPDENADYADLHKVKIRDLPRTDGDSENDKIVTVEETTGILRSVSKTELLSGIGGTDEEGPWLNQSDDQPATENDVKIYQMGNVAIGKTENFLDVALDVHGSFRGGDNTDNNSQIGSNSFGFGYNNEASNGYSTAFGLNNTASGSSAFTVGSGNEASAGHSTAIGNENTVSGINSIAIGYDNSVSGDSSFGHGNENEVSGDFSAAIGWDNEASGIYSIAMGKKNKALEGGAVAFGYDNEANDFYSFALGRNNKAEKAGAVAFGRDNEAQGNYSLTVGRHLISPASYSTSIGKYNAITTGLSEGGIENNNDDPIFQIGIGTSQTERVNALTILKDGQVGIGIIDSNIDPKPTEMLDIGSGQVRVRELYYTDGTTSDKIVVVDTDGILKSIDSDGFGGGTDGILFAGNGLSLEENDTKVILGGTLDQTTTIETSSENTLAFTGLETGNVTDKILVVDENGVLKKAKSMMPKFFHMAAVQLPVNQNQVDPPDITYAGGTYTVDLYQIYNKQFGLSDNNTSFSSAGTNHTLPILPADQLIYNITYYDNTVFEISELSMDGKLKYTIDSGAQITAKTYMNIVFEVID